MAKKKAAKKKTNGSTSTALATYDQKMAAYAQAAAEQEKGISGGKFFSLQGGVLKLDKNTLPGSRMGVVLLDSVIENGYNPDVFDPDNPSSPVCYAFGRDDETMSPHPDSEAPVSDKCDGCPNNDWGSADTGKGKACTNRRRIACISAGQFNGDDFEINTDPDHYRKADIVYLKLPPTALRAYASHVKQLLSVMGLPPFAVVTEVQVTPDGKTSFEVTFDTIDRLPPECVIEAIVPRHDAEAKEIEFPYPKNGSAPEAKTKGRRKASKAKKKARKRTGTSAY